MHVLNVTYLFLGGHLRWNQTGVMIAGTGAKGSGPTQFDKSACVVIDGNNSLFICDHHNDRVQKWLANATSGTTIAGSGTGGTSLSHPEYLTIDKYGYVYVTGHKLNEVLRFAPGSFNGVGVAGTGTAGSGLNELDTPADLVVDDDLNVYVIDSKNQRLMKWAPNATNGVVMISNFNSAGGHGLLFAPNSTNQVYVSDDKLNCIYLWSFNSTIPDLTLSQVSGTTTTLKAPSGIVYDTFQNLYVADNGNDRIVLFCANSTVGTPVIEANGTIPEIKSPMDVAFDSDLNMYVVLDGDMVIKYTLL